MQLDLRPDFVIELAYAKLNLDMAATSARNRLLQPGARMDQIDAHHEAKRFLDSDGALAPGPWIDAERRAHKSIGIELTHEAAASSLIETHEVWQEKAAEIGRIVRTAELKLSRATCWEDIKSAVSGIVWPTNEN